MGTIGLHVGSGSQTLRRIGGMVHMLPSRNSSVTAPYSQNRTAHNRKKHRYHKPSALNSQPQTSKPIPSDRQN